MGKNYQNIEDLLTDSLPKYSVPAGLEQKVLYAVHVEQKRSEKIYYNLWISSLFSSIIAVLSGLAWSIQSLNKEGAMEIIKTAISNLGLLRFSEVFWGILENLPINGLALTFCAITVLGLLTSMRKNHRVSILSFQHI